MAHNITKSTGPTGGNTTRSSCLGWSSVLLAVFIIPVLVYIGLIGLGAVLIIADPIHPVDAVVILSGDQGDRLGMAGDLLMRGFVNNLVITNTDEVANQQLVQDAIRIGFVPENIYITHSQVNSTLDEARALQEFAKSKGWKAFMIVTDPPHSLRTRLIFRQELRASGISIYVRPVVGHWFRSTNWFFTLDGWNYMFLEIGKIFNYLVFHY